MIAPGRDPAEARQTTIAFLVRQAQSKLPRRINGLIQDRPRRAVYDPREVRGLPLLPSGQVWVADPGGCPAGPPWATH
jgi:hypothetical protein